VKEAMWGRKYGYVRVSSKDQNIRRQICELEKLSIEKKNIFIDKQSGKDFNRPAFKDMVKTISEGDIIYVKSIDRLGRNYSEIQKWWRVITKEKGAYIKVRDMPILNQVQDETLLDVFISDLVLTLLSYIAENERNNIRRRQAEGIAAAKAQGVKFGRKNKPLPPNFEQVYWERKERKLTVAQAATKCGMARTTFYCGMSHWERNDTLQ